MSGDFVGHAAWREQRPERLGFDPAAVSEVLRLVASRGGSAQLCVLRGGEVLFDWSFGVAVDMPFLLFSAGKPLTAVLVHQLAEAGALNLDDPVARHWPEFGEQGKQHITIRQVLQHRSGLPYARSLARDALIATDWERSVRTLANARPHWAPGEVPAYHVLSFGFLLGELVQRVTGSPLRDVLRRQLLDPLELHDTYLGTPGDQWRRRVPLRGAGLGPAGVRQLLFNRRIVREAVIPAATVSSTARDLARFYQALLEGRTPTGGRILGPEALAQACTPSSDGELDRVLGKRIRWSQGFQLGGADDDPDRARPLGRLSSRRAFGHNGSNTCIGWADPDRHLVVAYLTDRLQHRLEGSPHQCAVSDAILAGCR
jgi:CubicO group peptidase (beta-lactamase class C family)